MVQPLITGERGAMALLTVDDQVTVSQEFSADPTEMTKAFGRLSAGRSRSAVLLDAAARAVELFRARPSGERRVLVLIGERPGLSSPDSLGAYLTLNRAGAKTDADRNCVSNIRPEGLAPQQAAGKVARLLAAAFQGGMTGVSLKDEDEPLLSSPNEAERGTILLTP
jgi:hypothetical protein